jgi:nickel-dependent lactate racemase
LPPLRQAEYDYLLSSAARKARFLTILNHGPYDALAPVRQVLKVILPGSCGLAELTSMPIMHFGTNRSLELEFDSDARVTFCDTPRGTPIADVRQAMRQTLVEPLAFPPLFQAVTPDDRVVVAISGDVPQADQLVAEVIFQLVEGNVNPTNITILTTSSADAESNGLRSLMPDAARGEIILRQHDPRDRDSLSYLAATEDATPVYLNRTLHEADFVIPIGVQRGALASGYFGIYSGIYPTFSDAATQARFRATAVAQPAEQRRLCKQASEVGRLLGTRFTVQIVPGVNGDVLDILAGDIDKASEVGKQAFQAAWHFEVPERAGLVVVGISGDKSQQSWENVGRALQMAGRVAAGNGDVILCSELSEPLGVGLDILTGAESILVALREIDRAKPADSLVATQVGVALERGRVYLVSDSPRGQVEDLGVHAIEADDVARITARYDSCIVIPNAQFVEASCASETPAKARTRRTRS